MSIVDSGICSQPGHEPTLRQPSLWESRRKGEPTDLVDARHRKARVLCRQCPLLSVCEQALSDLEKKRIPVDGVMAGRYCDVTEARRWSGHIQANCSVCGVELIPQDVSANHRAKKNQRQHVGQGLCSECYPLMAAAHSYEKRSA